MPHDVSLITTIAAGLSAALLFGFIATKLRLPPLVGYLLAGVAIGPATPGLVADVDLAGQLAEIGVMLLMFGVGLHFSMKDLLSVRRIAIPGAIVQMAVATTLGAGLALWWGWAPSAAWVFGFSLSCASTATAICLSCPAHSQLFSRNRASHAVDTDVESHVHDHPLEPSFCRMTSA